MDDCNAITSEQINETPLLLAVLKDMGVGELIDEHVRRHGGWEGASVGTLVCIWLCHILAERRHCLVEVREWAAARKQTLEALLGTRLRDTDLTDDRLASVLSKLGDPETQEGLDQAMMGRWIRVYRLPMRTLRLDSTSASVYHAESEPSTDKSGKEDKGLLHQGHSKDHRPDLCQFEAMLGTLDPAGVPVCVRTVAGNCADEPLYVPAYEHAVRVLGSRDVVVVGDSKMAALGTRGHLTRHGSRYVCAYRPKDKSQMAPWVEDALAHENSWQAVGRVVDEQTGEVSQKAFVYEWERQQTWTPPEAGRDPSVQDAVAGDVAWQERVLLVRSERQQAGQLRVRQRALDALGEKLKVLALPPKRGRRRYTEREALQKVVDAMVAEAKLTGLVRVSLAEEEEGQGPKRRFVFEALHVDAVAWEQMTQRLGWQVYLTSTTAHEQDAPSVVSTYFAQPIEERGFSRLKTRCLHLRPVYLRDEQRIAGLVWLLCLALRLLTLTEHRLREALKQRQEQIAGLNPASRNQTTANPTTERVLAAFQNLNLTLIQTPQGGYAHITPLNATQRHILALLNLPANLYNGLAITYTNSPFHLRE